MAVDPEDMMIYNAQRENFDLALALIESQKAKSYENEGHSSFREFVEDLEIDYRKAMYLIKTIRRMKRLRYTEPQVRSLIFHIGWTKTETILAGLDTRVAPSALVKKYGDMTTPQLRAEFAPKKRSSTLFTATITKGRRDKLYRLLERKYGLAKTKGKKQKVGAAFSALLDDVFNKSKVV